VVFFRHPKKEGDEGYLAAEKISRKKGTSKDALDKVVPSHDVLWHVFHRVFQEEPIFVPEYWPLLAILEPDIIYRVPERKIRRIRWQRVQILPTINDHPKSYIKDFEK
jgi:hypothetical protein